MIHSLTAPLHTLRTTIQRHKIELKTCILDYIQRAAVLSQECIICGLPLELLLFNKNGVYFHIKNEFKQPNGNYNKKNFFEYINYLISWIRDDILISRKHVIDQQSGIYDNIGDYVFKKIEKIYLNGINSCKSNDTEVKYLNKERIQKRSPLCARCLVEIHSYPTPILRFNCRSQQTHSYNNCKSPNMDKRMRFLFPNKTIGRYHILQTNGNDSLSFPSNSMESEENSQAIPIDLSKILTNSFYFSDAMILLPNSKEVEIITMAQEKILNLKKMRDIVKRHILYKMGVVFEQLTIVKSNYDRAILNSQVTDAEVFRILHNDLLAEMNGFKKRLNI